MFKITNKILLANNVKRMDFAAPNIAKKIRPGQFVSICVEQGDERIPLTVVESDARRGTIAVVFQDLTNDTKKLGDLSIKEEVFSILGPLGMPANIENVGRVVCVATGIGAAQILPICRAYAEAGNKVVGIIGAKTKKRILLEAQIRLTCSKVMIATDDGSYERKAKATDLLKELIEKQPVDLVYAIGSVDMMEAVAAATKTAKIPLRVQLKPYMVDCMGMCGSCRVKVGGQFILSCIDGPEFNGHKVDYQDYAIRINAFKEIDQWHNRMLRPSPGRNEGTILTRFLSGILKK